VNFNVQVNHEMEDWLSAPPRPMPEGEVSPSAARIALDVEVILTPPCIFH
jgi:hypothetical protein